MESFQFHIRFSGYLTGLASTHTVETERRVMGLELSPLTENISTEALLVKASLNYSLPFAMDSRFPALVGRLASSLTERNRCRSDEVD